MADPRDKSELEVAAEPIEPLEDAETASQNPSGALAVAAATTAAAAPRITRGLRGEIWRLSWPVMLSQVLVTAVALVDIAMVGRIGPHAVAAVGYATQFFFMIQSALFAVGFACVALMARALGGGRQQEARQALAASLAIGVGTAVVLSTAVLIAPYAILGLLNAEPSVAELTVPYMRLVLGSSVLLALSLGIESGLRAEKDTVTPMRISVAVATVKVALNVVLIFGLLGLPRLELVGAGVATAVSQLLGVVLFVGVVRRRSPGSAVRLRLKDFVDGRRVLGRVVAIAAPGVAERIILNFALLSYFAILGGYGTEAVAAYTVGVRALSFSWIPGIGFSAAVATLVGHALGQGEEQVAVDTGRAALTMALGVAVVLAVASGLARGPIARVFTDDPATIANLVPFLLCLALAQPMLQGHFTLAGVLRGAGDTWTPLVAAAVGNWGVRVPAALLCAVVFKTNIVWVWAVIILDHLARALWLLAAFRRGAWKRRLAVAPV